MPEYRKNNFREKVIERYGQTACLPLFEKENERVPKRVQTRFNAAPKSIPVATETKRLSRISHKINPAALTAKQQIVFDAFAELGASTNKEVADYLKKKFESPDAWDASTVNARNFELRSYGKLKAGPKRRCRITGEIVQTWEVVDTQTGICKKCNCEFDVQRQCSCKGSWICLHGKHRRNCKICGDHKDKKGVPHD